MAFAAPVLMLIAAEAIPALTTTELIIGGALLGGGLAAAQSAITGQPITPQGEILGALGGALPGVGSALGGMGGIASALGLGGASSAGGAAAGSIAETAGAAATEALAPTATAALAGPGGTAASAAGTIGMGAVDPIYGSTVVGGSPALGPASSVPTGAFFSGAGAGGGGGGGFGSMAKNILDVGGKLSSIGNFGMGALNFAKQLGGAGQSQEQTPMMARGTSLGGQYTTGQAGQYTPYTYEGGLGTAPTSGYLDPAGKFISSKQRQGSLGDLATTVLG